MKLTIHNYHKVSPDGDRFVPALHPDLFAGQMAHLARWYRVVDLAEGVRSLQEGGGGHRVAITFDDGYDCFARYAWPVLGRYGLPATVFVATGAVDRHEPVWTDGVAVMVRDTGAERLVLDADGTERVFDTGSEALREAAAAGIKSLLKSVPDATRLACMEGLRAQAGRTAGRGPVPLDAATIRRLAGEGVRFGAHTVRHPILSRVDVATAMHEMRDSRDRLEELCGHPVTAFAYPNGTPDDYTADTVALVRDCGFTCAVTTVDGTNRTGDDPFTLKRTYTTFPGTMGFARHLLKVRWQ